MTGIPFHRCFILISLLLFLRSGLTMYRLELLAFDQPTIRFSDEIWSEHPAEPLVGMHSGNLLAIAEPRELLLYEKKIEKQTRIIGKAAWFLEDPNTAKLNLETEQSKLWGTLKIHYHRHFSINSRLLFEADPGSLPSRIRNQFSGQIAKFRINEKHRLTPGKLYYYDHPIIGILLIFSKIEKKNFL